MSNYKLRTKDSELIELPSDPREYQITGTFMVVRYYMDVTDQDQLQHLIYEKAVEQYDRRRLVDQRKDELAAAKARLKNAEIALEETSKSMEKYGEWLSVGFLEEQLSVDERNNLKHKFYIIKAQEVSGFKLDGGTIAEIEYTEPGQPAKWVEVVSLGENLFNQPEEENMPWDDDDDEDEGPVESDVQLEDEIKAIQQNDRIMYLDWLVDLVQEQFQENVNVEDWVVQHLITDDQLFVRLANRFNTQETIVLPEVYINENGNYYNNSVADIANYINKAHDINIQPEHYEVQTETEAETEASMEAM